MKILCILRKYEKNIFEIKNNINQTVSEFFDITFIWVVNKSDDYSVTQCTRPFYTHIFYEIGTFRE